MARRRNDPPLTGVLLIDKPAGATSHDVVAAVRRALNMRRVGHAGTLDPMATGVLVVGVGSTTRLLGIVGGHDKDYLATIRLGASTVTDDREGEVVATCEPEVLKAVTDERVHSAVAEFVGMIAQRPSAVSAVKIDGKRSYQRVREGQEVELPERMVTVSTCEVLGIERSDDWVDVRVRVACSAGTYIRALARDLGAVLGVGGHLCALRRTRSGNVPVAECRGIEDLSSAALVTPAQFARRELPVLEVQADEAIKVRNGIRLLVSAPDTSGLAVIGPGDDLLAVAEVVGGSLNYRAVFPPSGDPADRG